MTSTDRSLAVYVGMQVDLNGRELTLAPKTPINQIGKRGLELELPDNVFLGKVGQTADGLINSFIPDNPNKDKFKIDEIKTGIDAVDTIIEKIKAAELSLSKFHVKIPPKYKTDQDGKYIDGSKKVIDFSKPNANSKLVTIDNDDQAPTEYTVALAATWSDPATNSSAANMGGFDMTLKGLVVMFTNENQDDLDQIKMIKEATTEAQKVLAPSRELNAKKLKAQQKLAQATKAKEDLTTKNSTDAQNKDTDCGKLVKRAEKLIEEAKNEIIQLKGEVSEIEQLMSDTNAFVAELAPTTTT